MSDRDKRLTWAFAELFATNRTHFRDRSVWGGPGYYGVEAAAVTEDATEVTVTVTFRAGKRYCCFESGCHASYYREDWWERLRDCLDRHGLGELPLPVVRTFGVVVERGAVFQPGMIDNPDTCFISEELQYQVGPWHPILGARAGSP